MVDSPRKLTVTTSKSALEESRHGADSSASVSSNKSYSRSSAVHRCSSSRSLCTSPRPLPTPPVYASAPASVPTSSLSTPASSPSSLSLPTPQRLPHSYPPRPLPKMPKSATVTLNIPQHLMRLDERLPPPTSPALSTMSCGLPRRPIDVEEIRRGNLSKLRRHLGYSVPPDLVPPGLDRSKDEHCDFPTVPITPECLSEGISPTLEKSVDEQTMRQRWLREKKGRRWVEEDYNVIIESLRALR